MADNLNAEDATSASTLENNELIPFVESLEPTHSDKTEKVEDEVPENCTNITADIIEPIVSGQEINSLIFTTEHDISNDDLEIKVEEKHTDENLLNIDSENKLDQIDTNVTGCMDNDESAISVPNIENKIMESISEIESNIDQADQIVEKDITGKLQFKINYLISYF